MKTIFKSVTLLISAIFLLFLTGCLDTEGGNSQTFSREPLMISETNPTTIVDSWRPNSPKFYAPALDGKGLPVGQCLVANFKIDYDNQPNAQYYTISEMYDWVPVPDSLAVRADTNVVDYNTPIMKMEVFKSSGASATSNTIFIGNTIFVSFVQKDTQGASFLYAMRYDTITKGSSTVNPSLYISAKASGTGGNTDTYKECLHAFDLTPFFSFMGSSNGKTLTIDVKCLTAVKDSSKVYKTLDTIQRIIQ